DLHDAPARDASDAQRDVERQRARGNGVHRHPRAGITHAHDRALAELALDLCQGPLKGRLALGIGLWVRRRTSLRAAFLLITHLCSAPCLMRFEPTTVGPWADGTTR